MGEKEARSRSMSISKVFLSVSKIGFIRVVFEYRES